MAKGNENLHSALKAKNDEFYTQLSDIEKELRHYKEHFQGKTVLCNCDDPRVSNFFHYFSYNFEKLGLKKLITICYKNQEIDLFSKHTSERAIYLEYNGCKEGENVPTLEEIGIKHLQGDGDFRSKECIDLLQETDIVVTNPPFSLFREYVAQLIEYQKKFLIIGNQNAISYKEIFYLFMDNKIWLGYNNNAKTFHKPDGTTQTLGNTGWFTNLETKKRHENIILYKTYNETDYPKYDNFEAIEVSKVSDIPYDYKDTMGVPITFLDKYNPDQFEILGITKTWFGGASKIYPNQTQVSKDGSKSTVSKLNDGATIKMSSPPRDSTYYIVDNEIFIQLYARILIKRKDI